MEQMDKKVVELLQEMSRGQGINDQLLIEIFVRTYLEPEPIALDELSQKTGYSLASVSNKAKILSDLMHCQRLRKPGSKKVYLYMEKDILKILKESLIRKEQYVIKLAKEKLPLIIDEYKDKNNSDKDKKKIQILENYYGQILKFETALKKVITELNKL